MTTPSEFTPEQIAEVLAKPGPARDQLATDEVGYLLAPGYRLEYRGGRFEEERLKRHGHPRDAYGEWVLCLPVGLRREGRHAIGLADAKPNPRRYRGLTFAQALVKCRVLRDEVEALPKRTLGDVARAYVEHLRASSDSSAAEAEADLQAFLQANRNADDYFARFPYMNGRHWRVELFAHLSGRRINETALGDRPRVRAFVTRIVRHFIAACDHAYAAGNSGLTVTPWRRFEQRLSPEGRAKEEGGADALRAQRHPNARRDPLAAGS